MEEIKLETNNDPLNIICFNCKSDNPAGSKFCNKCGTQILLKCAHCANSNNLPDAVYCNQCGLELKKKISKRIQGDDLLQSEKYQSNQYNYDGFHEYSLPEYNFKIKYHPDWEKTDGEELENVLGEWGISNLSYVVIFRPSIYDLHVSLLNSLFVNISDFSTGYTLQDYVAHEIRNLKQDHSDFLLDNSKSLVINGKTWHWLSYFIEGKHHLYVITFSGNKSYTMGFISESEEYKEYLPILESMMGSFEFIYSTRLIDSESSHSHDIKIKCDFIEFSDPSLRFKINYPTSWIKMIKPDEKNVVYFQKVSTSNDLIAKFIISVVDLTVKISNSNDNPNEIAKKFIEDHNIEKIESTTLNGSSASQIEFEENGINFLVIICENSSKTYILSYLASPDNYNENFMIAEQMISSFEFL